MIGLLIRTLEKANFIPLQAVDGETGVARAREQQPALIILDLLLPKLSGLEVCRVLKGDRSTAQIPIIMLTAKSEEIDRVVGLAWRR